MSNVVVNEGTQNQNSGGMGFAGMILVLGFIMIAVMAGAVFIFNAKNKGNQVALLDLKPVSASFYNYGENVPKAFLNNVSFSVEITKEDYGTMISKEASVYKNSKSYFLQYKYFIPQKLQNDEQFKSEFKKNFLAVREQFDREDFSKVDFDEVYKLQLEMDELMKSKFTSREKIVSVTPNIQPRYDLLLKLD